MTSGTRSPLLHRVTPFHTLLSLRPSANHHDHHQEARVKTNRRPYKRRHQNNGCAVTSVTPTAALPIIFLTPTCCFVMYPGQGLSTSFPVSQAHQQSFPSESEPNLSTSHCAFPSLPHPRLVSLARLTEPNIGSELTSFVQAADSAVTNRRKRTPNVSSSGCCRLTHSG